MRLVVGALAREEEPNWLLVARRLLGRGRPLRTSLAIPAVIEDRLG